MPCRNALQASADEPNNLLQVLVCLCCCAVAVIVSVAVYYVSKREQKRQRLYWVLLRLRYLRQVLERCLQLACTLAVPLRPSIKGYSVLVRGRVVEQACYG
jgi:hypothetical protein